MKKILLILCLLIPVGLIAQNLTGTNINAISGTNLTTSLAGKVAIADSNKTSAGNYITNKKVVDTYAPIASPTFTGTVTSPAVAISTTDTASGSYPVGTIQMRITGGDTSMWVKIRLTGTVAARWKKLTP